MLLLQQHSLFNFKNMLLTEHNLFYYLLDKGMVDMVVDRRNLKATISTLLSVLMSKRASATAGGAEPVDLIDEMESQETPAPSKRKPAKAPRAKAAE